jgi:carbon monoxide dehydrogenase subunit G
MNLENTFTVPADINEAWALLLDVERVASACRVPRSIQSTVMR